MTSFTIFRRLLELIRFSHTIFALPFALLAALLAWQEQPFRWRDFVGILLCMIFARSAAMAFNRVVDQHVDAQNPRTATRHLPAELLSSKSVILFTLLCWGHSLPRHYSFCRTVGRCCYLCLCYCFYWDIRMRDVGRCSAIIGSRLH